MKIRATGVDWDTTTLELNQESLPNFRISYSSVRGATEQTWSPGRMCPSRKKSLQFAVEQVSPAEYVEVLFSRTRFLTH